MKTKYNQSDVEIASRKVLSSGFFTLESIRLRHRLFSGQWSDWMQRERIQAKDAVAVLPYDPQHDSVLLIEQFRPGCLEAAYPWLFEVVSGYIDPGEAPLVAAKRELHEETGCHATDFIPIQTVWMGPGNSGGQMHLFAGCVALGDALQFAGRALEHEDIAIHPITRTQFLDALNTGALSNWSTVICAAWLAQQGTAIRTQWIKRSK